MKITLIITIIIMIMIIQFNPFFSVCLNNFEIITKSKISQLADDKIRIIIKEEVKNKLGKKDIYYKKELKIKIELEKSFNIFMNFKSCGGLWKVSALIETNTDEAVLDGYINNCGDFLYYKDSI